MSAQQISASVNERNFIHNMRLMFSSNTSYVKELLQNANRAEATKVLIDFQDDVLTVVDDGKGIEDFSKLVTFSESGWDQQIVDSQKPYGLGVASYFFACDEVEFYSNGKKFSVVCEDLINGKPALLTEDSSVTKGTKVVLKRLNQSNSNMSSNLIKSLANAFPLPVFYNGNEIERPHALNDDFVEFEFGRLKLVSLENINFNLYLQGLPIGDIHNYKPNIVHLDSVKFDAVMPDRAYLYDHAQKLLEINGAVVKFIINKICNIKKEMGIKNTEFYNTYVRALKSLSSLELLNDIPVAGYPFLFNVRPIYGEDAYTATCGLILEEDVASGKVIVIKNLDDFESDPLTCKIAAIMEEKSWYSLSEETPEGHWLRKYAIDIEDLEIAYRGHGTKRVGCVEGVNVEMYDSLDAVITDGKQFNHIVEIHNYAFLPKDDLVDSHYGNFPLDLTVLMTCECNLTPHLALCDFLDEHGSFMDSYESEVSDIWRSEMEKLKGCTNFAKNLDRLLRNSTCTAQSLGDMAVTVAGQHSYGHKTYNLDAEFFKKFSQATGLDYLVAQSAFKSVLNS